MLFDEFAGARVLGGAPFNVARHLCGLGLDPLLVTRVGEDSAGTDALDEMAAAGLDTSGVQRDPDYPTGRVRIIVAGAAHQFEIPERQAYDYIDAGVARRAAVEARPAVTYWGTLAQRCDISRLALSAVLDGVASVRVFDVNLRAPWYGVAPIARSFRAADVVKLNRGELDRVSTMLGVGTTSETERVRRLIDFYALTTLVVTDGRDGISLTTSDGRVWRAHGPAVAVVDTVGAGDAATAALVAGELLGWSVEESIERADALARAICQIRGAVPTSNTFYEPFRRAWNVVAP